MKVKVESEKVGLKLNIQKTKIMATGPITSWQIDEETMETVIDFIFLSFKIISVSSRRSCRSSHKCSTSPSLALVVGAQTWITVILNGLSWKQTKIILLF